MNFIIVGAGSLGSSLALQLSQRGYNVTIIDRDEVALHKMDPDFNGRKILGNGIDVDVLTSADIKTADGLAAVTTSDSVNLVVAQIAQKMFHVERVIARVVEPEGQEAYRKLGIQTVSPTSVGVTAMLSWLLGTAPDVIVPVAEGVTVVSLPVPAKLTGKTVQELEQSKPVRIIAVRNGDGRFALVTDGTVLGAGMHLICAINTRDVDAFLAGGLF